ncbi:hypothetical protein CAUPRSCDRAFT_11647, partial [Caulochytrium protostelioides]
VGGHRDRLKETGQAQSREAQGREQGIETGRGGGGRGGLELGQPDEREPSGLEALHVSMGNQVAVIFGLSTGHGGVVVGAGRWGGGGGDGLGRGARDVGLRRRERGADVGVGEQGEQHADAGMNGGRGQPALGVGHQSDVRKLKTGAPIHQSQANANANGDPPCWSGFKLDARADMLLFDRSVSPGLSAMRTVPLLVPVTGSRDGTPAKLRWVRDDGGLDA